MKSIFISSTFKDMQAERDLLHERIFPRLRRVIAEYGEDVQELDLRWGVDTANMTEEESGRLVLKVCIDAIDRCLPFIIVLLGERYGWIPREDIVASAQDTRVDEHYIPGMSVTNLEIQYGALREEEVLERCVFCMRNPEVIGEIEPEYRGIYEGESAEHMQKLSDLKQKIREKDHAVILEYDAKWDADKHKISGLEAFGEELYSILEKMIREEYKDHKEMDWREKILMETRRTKELYLSSYVERPIEEAQVCRNVQSAFRSHELEESVGNMVSVKGVAGAGKSALMAACAERLEQIGYHVITYFSGNPGCQDPKVFKQILRYELENIRNLKFHYEGETKHMTLDENLSILGEIAKEKKVVCVIDALDQLYEKEKEPELDFVRLCPDVIFVTSFLDDFRYTVPLGEKIHLWKSEVKELTRANKEQMIQYTAGKRGKKLDDIVARDIAEKENSSNPLYLSNMLQRFFMMDGKEFEKAEKQGAGMDGIHRYMEQLLSEMPEKQEEMVLYLLKETMQHFEAEYLYEVMCLIALSKFGLKESELADLLKIEGKTFAQIEFQQLVSYLYEAFVQKADGKWTFKHRLFMEAMRNSMNVEDKNKCMELLVQYAKTDEAFLKQEGYYYVFAEKNTFGAVILKNWSEYDVDNLGEGIVELVERDASYEQYFCELAEVYGTDRFVEFWEKEFEKYAYHKTGEMICVHVIQKLIESNRISLVMQCKCINTVMNYCFKHRDYTNARSYIEKLERFLDQLPEAEREYYYAILYSAEAVRAEYSEKNMVKALEYDEKALAHIERAGQLRPKDEDVLYRKSRIKRNLFWDYQDVKREWHPELLESALADASQHKTELDDSRFASETITVLGDLTFCYYSRESACYNEEFGKYYYTQAMVRGRAWVKKYPSVSNMKTFIYVLDDIAWVVKRCYRYEFDKEAYSYCKRRFEMSRTLEAKETLARKCRELADSAVDAWEEYQKNGSYKIETSRSELEKEIVKYNTEAISLYKELVSSYPEHADYIRWLYSSKLGMAKFKLQTEPNRETYEWIMAEIKPVPELILKSESDRYIYDTFEILENAAQNLGYYDEAAAYAEMMLNASQKLVEQKNTKWIRRRVFKSYLCQAETLYENGADAEEALKTAYQYYRDMDEEAKEGQIYLADSLYQMYIQVMFEKKNMEYAGTLGDEAMKLEGSFFCYYPGFDTDGYYKRVFQWEETVPSSGKELWDGMQKLFLSADKRKKTYLAKRIGDMLVRQGHWDEKDEEYIDAFCWEHVLQYMKEVNETIDVSLLLYIIRNCFLAENYEDAIVYLQKIEEESLSEEQKEEQKFLDLLCQAMTDNTLIKAVGEMPYYQKLCEKEVDELKLYEEAELFAVYEWMLIVTEGEEKSCYLERFLTYASARRRDFSRGVWVKKASGHLFGRHDMKEILAGIPVENIFRSCKMLDKILRSLVSKTEQIKACIRIADRLSVSDSEEYLDKAREYYHKSCPEDWQKIKKMTEEELEVRLWTYDRGMKIHVNYENEEVFKYQLLMLEYYRRTRNAEVFELVLKNKKQMEAAEIGEEECLIEAIEESAVEFYKELIRMRGDSGLDEYVDHLKKAEYLNAIALGRLLELKEDIRDYVSEKAMENFNQILETKGRNDLVLIEDALKAEVRA